MEERSSINSQAHPSGLQSEYGGKIDKMSRGLSKGQDKIGEPYMQTSI